MIRETDSIATIPLIGEKYQILLKNLDIKTVGDLLRHYPNRYVDFSTISTVTKLQPGETATVLGTISSFTFRPTRKKGFTIQEAILTDTTGSIKLLWFNQPYLRTVFAKGMSVSIAGTVEEENGKLLCGNPEYEISRSPIFKGLTLSTQGQTLIHVGRLVPIYPETKGISSKWIRSKMALITGISDWYRRQYDIVSQLSEWIPETILEQERLIPLQQACREIHFPSSFEKLEQAKKRLAFDELLTQQLIGQYRKQQWKEKKQAKRIAIETSVMQQFIKQLPFQLTNDQEKAVLEILEDISKSTSMNRLLQGDVGSGKTVVAAMVSFASIKAGYQVALMVPTQVLADQHAETLTALLKPFGMKIALLTGAVKRKKEKGRKKKEIYPDLLIGTHALLHERAKQSIDKDRLALVIIDEQHRFGVEQRATLIESGAGVHVLSMTATPIPRTISLTLYGNLDLSLIQQMPKGRIQVKTWVVPESKRQASYQWMKEQIKKGQQIFIVCPLIELSEHESLQNIKAATAEYEKLQRIFPEFRLSLLHGNISPSEKYQILLKMKERKIHMLVATPVIEVGVDIPGATIIVIEGADRFGLAQLHQLRGRVGRNTQQSYCLLFSTNPKISRRLKILETVHSGLALSELDLKWRGPGQLFSSEQHGWTKFKLADINDIETVRTVHQIAVRFVSEQGKYPLLKRHIQELDNSIAPN